MKTLPYIGIIILLVIILLQNRSCKGPEVPNAPRIDTVIVYETIRDTIPGEIQYISTKIDTSIWMKRTENVPDTSYTGLLYQYTQLGNRYFATNTFKTDFPISDYGYVTVTDSIYGNWLMSTTLTTNLNIPTTTITIEKEAPKRNEFYTGTTFTGSKITPLTAVYGNLLLKNKKDRLYGVGMGWDGENTVYSLSLYWKIKLRK